MFSPENKPPYPIIGHASPLLPTMIISRTHQANNYP